MDSADSVPSAESKGKGLAERFVAESAEPLSSQLSARTPCSLATVLALQQTRFLPSLASLGVDLCSPDFHPFPTP